MTHEMERARLEQDVRALAEKGDARGAATLVLRAYGGEIFGFLMSLHRDEVLANDAFSLFAERLWRGLPSFVWGSSLRTWAYVIARNAAHTARRDAERQGRRGKRANESALDDVAQAVRTETLDFLKTEKRTRLEALRDALSPEERALLLLRVDRKMAWNELAHVLSDSDAPLDEAGALREAARLRKRFQVLEDRLRE